MKYVVKQRKSGDWIALDAATPSEAAKRAARSWGLHGNAWVLVAEGNDGFNHSGEFEIYTASGEKVDFTDGEFDRYGSGEEEKTTGERPCTCGSGVHWAFCQENSPYCG